MNNTIIITHRITLPTTIRACVDFMEFKSKLKTHLFNKIRFRRALSKISFTVLFDRDEAIITC